MEKRGKEDEVKVGKRIVLINFLLKLRGVLK